MSASISKRQNLLGGVYSPKRARALLVEWANIPADYWVDAKTGEPLDSSEVKLADEGISRLMKHHPEIFALVLAHSGSVPSGRYEKITEDQWHLVASIQDLLRRAWETADARAREWYIFRARQLYHFESAVKPLSDKRMKGRSIWEMVSSELSPEEQSARRGPPLLTEFERVMYLFQRISKDAKRCPNPECPAPFFFAQRKNQKYCTEKCAAVGQREQKREWWRKNRGKS